MPGILVGIDGSHHSLHALEWAAREAAIRNAPLTVLTVHQAIVGYFGAAIAYPDDKDFLAGARKMAQEETDLVLGQLKTGPRPQSVEVLAVTGLPAGEILRAGEHADMIVVGSRGAGGFMKLLLGSVSSQVAHHAHCPVVIIPGDRN